MTRCCCLCDIALPAGTAQPILHPDAKDSPGPEWMCIDEMACDQRQRLSFAAFLDAHPPTPLRDFLARSERVVREPVAALPGPVGRELRA